jgi:hypothetical protein
MTEITDYKIRHMPTLLTCGDQRVSSGDQI